MKIKYLVKELEKYDPESELFLEADYQEYAGGNTVTDVYRITRIYGRRLAHAVLGYCGEKEEMDEKSNDNL